MWILYAFGSALFAGLTAVLAARHPKDGFNGCDCPDNRGSGLFMADGVHRRFAGTAFRNQRKTLLFLILSGLATGASWLCYFRALQIGDINKVVPVDKSSTVLTILRRQSFFHESLSIAKGAGIVLIAAGTYLMIEKKAVRRRGKGWKQLASVRVEVPPCSKGLTLHSRQDRHFRR